MKLKKKSGLIGAIVALSCASMISVGFASWVISQGDEKEVTGSITVDNVTEKNYAIHLGSGQTDGELNDVICFGWAAFDNQDGALTNHQWLSNDDKLDGANGVSSAENLEASFDFTIDNISGAIDAANGPVKSVSGNTAVLENNYNLTAVLAVKTGTYNTTVGGQANVLAALPTPVLSYAAGTFTCTVTFAWGSYFDVNGEAVNPMTYYNSQEGTAALKAEASTILTALNEMSFTFGITLTVAQ